MAQFETYIVCEEVFSNQVKNYKVFSFIMSELLLFSGVIEIVSSKILPVKRNFNTAERLCWLNCDSSDILLKLYNLTEVNSLSSTLNHVFIFHFFIFIFTLPRWPYSRSIQTHYKISSFSLHIFSCEFLIDNFIQFCYEIQL